MIDKKDKNIQNQMRTDQSHQTKQQKLSQTIQKKH